MLYDVIKTELNKTSKSQVYPIKDQFSDISIFHNWRADTIREN